MGDTSDMWAWPWACHRDGHVFIDDERCVECGIRYELATATTAELAAAMRIHAMSGVDARRQLPG